MTRVNRNIVTVLKVLAGSIAFIIVYLSLSGRVFGAELDKYEPISAGVCKDVELPCVFMMRKDTPFFYAVFKDGKLIAITELKGGKETVIWGTLKLPLKKGESEI